MDLADPWPWCYIHLPRRTIARSGCRCRLARFCRVLIRRVKVADVGFCTIPVFVFCTRAYVIINTEEILSQITKESSVRSILSSPIEQKQRKRTRKNVSAMREEVVFHSPQKCDFAARNDGKRARERKWANWTRNPYQLNSNFLVRLYVRSCARERVVSILFIAFWIGRGRNQFALHRRTRGQRLMMSYFRYANRLVLSSYKTNTQPAQLGKKKNHSLSILT